MNKSHSIELTIDGKTVRTEAEELMVKIDDLPVFQLPNTKKMKSSKIQTLSLKFLLRSANAALGHDERYGIVKNLAESPKTFTEISDIFDMPSPTLDFHLKKLVKNWVAYKMKDGKYAVTLLGELLLDYFSKFIEEATKLQEYIDE